MKHLPFNYIQSVPLAQTFSASLNIYYVYYLPTVGTTQIVARDGFMVRPLTVLVSERCSERHDSSLDPGATDMTETATHCIVASSVNSSVPF